jgi:glycosyltransferase involved in cell wall biosynthesis
MNVAVVIPLFNGSKFIRSTLESVFLQSRPPVEVIVVDDRSEDESVDIVKTFPGVTLLTNPAKGAEEARKVGFSFTDAEAVAFLDQDDIWHSEHLRLLADVLEHNPACPIAVSKIQTFTNNNEIDFGLPIENVKALDPWSTFPRVGIHTPSALLFRRSALEVLDGWPTGFPGVNDYYLPLRLSVSQPLFKNNGVTVAYRKHRESTYRDRQRLSFFRTFKAASEDAIIHRISVRPQDEARLRKCFMTLTAIEGILKSTIDLNRSLLVDSAIAFENNVSGESISFVENMANVMFWHLGPLFFEKQEKIRGGGPDFLLNYWPAQARNTLEVCQRMLTSWGYPWFI